jgi:hypothetical protein
VKNTYIHIFTAIVIVSARPAPAQGTFQNLNFEEANIVAISGQPLAVTVANALPGWTVYYGNVQQTQISYNDALLGGEPWLTLSANGYPGIPEMLIDGNFTPFLQGGGVNGVPTPVSISQTGQIPPGTQSILFDCSGNFSPPSELDAFIGSSELSLFQVGSGANYTIYGGNVSAWAGQTEQLTFSASLGNFAIDDISFSPNSVPEPDILALIGIGGLTFAAGHWGRRRKS